MFEYQNFKSLKRAGTKEIWSDPILSETQLQGTFVRWKDAKDQGIR